MPRTVALLHARFRIVACVAALLVTLLPSQALADDLGEPINLSSWTLTWGGYLHVAYRWIQQPMNYSLAGHNNGFQLEQARVGINVQYKEMVAVRLSFEGASEDRLSQSFPGGELTTRLRDAYVTWAPLKALRITVGQMVTPWDLDSMRSDSELPFVSRSVASEGVQPSEGYDTRGMGVDRNLGIAIHSGDIPLPRSSSFRYELFVGNGNGENKILNDNNLPAVFGRVEYAFWWKAGIPKNLVGPMRARTDLAIKPVVGIGLAGQYNPRTAGNLPNLINETDVGGAADLIVSIIGIDLQGGLLYTKTIHNTLGATPDWERFGWWAHLRYTIPKLPFDLIPGYRISNYAPRAHLLTSGGTDADRKTDEDLTVLYHTFGIAVRPVRSFPMHANVNYTLTTERGPNVLKNDRLEFDVVVCF